LRFERGVDFAITEVAMERATQLIIAICGGQASDINTCIDETSLPILAFSLF
jgi:phenylalanyl-tRNA synthetase beta chain